MPKNGLNRKVELPFALVAPVSTAGQEIQAKQPGVQVARSCETLYSWTQPMVLVLGSSATLSAVGVLGAQAIACEQQLQRLPGLILREPLMLALQDRIGPRAVTAFSSLLLLTAFLQVLPYFVARAVVIGGTSCLSADEYGGPIRLRIIALSLSAAVLSALACVNWALAFVASLAVLLLAFLAWPAGRQIGAGIDQVATQREYYVSAVSLPLLSPPVVLLLLGIMTNPRSNVLSIVEALLDLPSTVLQLQCRSHVAVKLVFWGLYLPLWTMCAAAQMV